VQRQSAEASHSEQMVQNIRIGATEVFWLSDGRCRMDGGALFGLVPRVLWMRYYEPDERNRLPLALNCLLLRSGGKTIIVETGIGEKLDERARDIFAVEKLPHGGLLGDLARHGVAPEDVDIVINTHLHADHCGGNTVWRDGRAVPAFPRAEYWAVRGEWDDATHPNERTRATYLAENLLPVQETGQLRLIEGKTQVTDEVRIRPAPGHTRSHVIVEIAGDGRVFQFWGDVAQNRVQIERLAWISAFDTFPLDSLETKRRLIHEAIERQAIVLLAHEPQPGRLRPAEGNLACIFEPVALE
jgi:glyoxylase-like metal-dependent hydrolase (beta-lactamase superfamily II)